MQGRVLQALPAGGATALKVAVDGRIHEVLAASAGPPRAGDSIRLALVGVPRLLPQGGVA